MDSATFTIDSTTECSSRCTIPLAQPVSGVLTIGTRDGAFPAMAEKRVFRVVLVGSGHGVGEQVTTTVDKEVTYDGKEIRIKTRLNCSRCGAE